MPQRTRRPADEMDTRNDLAEHVGSELPPAERETAINHVGRADEFDVITYAKPWVRALLNHDYATVRWVFLASDDGRGERVDDLADALERARSPGGPLVEGVSAKVPIGALTIKGKPRTNDHLSNVVNTPDDADAARERFAEAE